MTGRGSLGAGAEVPHLHLARVPPAVAPDCRPEQRVQISPAQALRRVARLDFLRPGYAARLLLAGPGSVPVDQDAA